MKAPNAQTTARWLMALVVLGLVLRAVVWHFKGGFHYPDEIFQQLEPAHHLRTGTGWLPWEFVRGLRPWIFPWLYAGLLEVLSQVGIEGHAALRAVNLHNSLWTALIIPAAFRMGRAVATGSEEDPHGALTGLLAASVAAVWPTLLYFGPHALMGTPSMVCLAWGYAFWLEDRRDEAGLGRAALWMGLCFGFAGMCRFTSGLHMLVPILDLVLRRRFRAFGWMMVGAIPGILVLGIVDWATWGRPFHSAIEHFSYNYLEDGASQHGTSPWHTYWTQAFGERFGPALVLVLPVLALSARRAWPLLLSALVPLVLLSTIAHKEERFLMHNWPLLTAALGIGLAVLGHKIGARSKKAAIPVVAVVMLAMVGSNVFGTSKLEWRWRAGIFQAQAYVGQQPDASGLLLDDRQHLNGGQLALNRTIPQIQASPRWFRRPIFNYAALKSGHPHEAQLLKLGWAEVARFEGIIVLRRETQK